MARPVLKILAILVALAVLAGGLMQLVRPPVVRQPEWPDAQVEALARRACLDCHSDETRGPWYAQVAPASWLLAREVAGARRHLNFSEWRGPEHEEIQEVVMEGEVPPALCLLMHPSAHLTPSEKLVLAQGLAALR